MSAKRFRFTIRHIRLLHSLKDSLWAFLFAFMISLFSVIGYLMTRASFFSFFSLNSAWVYVSIVLLTLLGAELFLRFRDVLVNKFSKVNTDKTSCEGKMYFSCLIVILLMWLPVLIAYYPGLFAYDVMVQIPQEVGTYNTQQPLVHTLLLQFFYYVIGEQLMGSYNNGMLCYTLFQMLILAMAISYMHLFLYRMGVGKKIRLVILIFTGIFPVYSILAISMTKDIIFAAFFLLSFLCISYWELMPDFFERKHLGFLYLFSVIGTALFRNNGIYVVILFFIIGLLFSGRKNRKKLLFLSMAGIFFSMSLQGMMKYAVSASTGSPNEMLSVPYQQLSYVYNMKKDELSFDDINEIESFVPHAWNYDLYVADYVKGTGKAWEHKKQFVLLYFKMFARYPFAYIKAFLYNTMGYWYLFDTSNAEIYGYGLENRQGYLLTDTKPGFGIVHNSYFPILENLYEKLFSLNEYQNNPVLFILCSMALYIWAIVLCLFFAISLKRKQALLPLTFLLSFIITILAGPCALIRYAFPIISCIPPLYVVTFRTPEKAEN